MKACFFDMDGTIIDSRADLAATVNHTRRDLGLEELAQDDVLVHVGRGAKYLLAHAIPEKAGGPDDLFGIFMSHYEEHMLESVTLYPGVRETLEELDARGWLLGVNTAKPARAVKAILEHFGLVRYFGDAVVAGGDCAEMKPSPLPLYECSKRMREGASGASHSPGPGDWMVGDNWTDVKCAANAGINSAFCNFGFGILAGETATARIDRFDGLLDLLGDAK